MSFGGLLRGGLNAGAVGAASTPSAHGFGTVACTWWEYWKACCGYGPSSGSLLLLPRRGYARGMNPSRSRLERESSVACENQDNVVCQFCQDQDQDAQGTKEKLGESNDGAAGRGGSLSQLRVSRSWAHNCCCVSSLQHVRYASVFCSLLLLTLLLVLRLSGFVNLSQTENTPGQASCFFSTSLVRWSASSSSSSLV